MNFQLQKNPPGVGQEYVLYLGGWKGTLTEIDTLPQYEMT